MILAIDISALDYGVKMTTINITKNITDAFTSHGEKEYPHECCGFIIGSFNDDESYGLEYLPASNVKEENRERRFLIDLGISNDFDNLYGFPLSILSAFANLSKYTLFIQSPP